jgi:6-phosphofructokinase 2
MGAQGALLVTRDGTWRGYAPEVRTISAVGAGDSFLGALVARRVLGNNYDEALRYAIAAGTASLLSPGTGLSSREGIEAMLPRVRIETISR